MSFVPENLHEKMLLYLSDLDLFGYQQPIFWLFAAILGFGSLCGLTQLVCLSFIMVPLLPVTYTKANSISIKIYKNCNRMLQNELSPNRFRFHFEIIKKKEKWKVQWTISRSLLRLLYIMYRPFEQMNLANKAQFKIGGALFRLNGSTYVDDVRSFWITPLDMGGKTYARSRWIRFWSERQPVGTLWCTVRRAWQNVIRVLWPHRRTKCYVEPNKNYAFEETVCDATGVCFVCNVGCDNILKHRATVQIVKSYGFTGCICHDAYHINHRPR